MGRISSSRPWSILSRWARSPVRRGVASRGAARRGACRTLWCVRAPPGASASYPDCLRARVRRRKSEQARTRAWLAWFLPLALGALYWLSPIALETHGAWSGSVFIRSAPISSRRCPFFPTSGSAQSGEPEHASLSAARRGYAGAFSAQYRALGRTARDGLAAAPDGASESFFILFSCSRFCLFHSILQFSNPFAEYRLYVPTLCVALFLIALPVNASSPASADRSPGSSSRPLATLVFSLPAASSGPSRCGCFRLDDRERAHSGVSYMLLGEVLEHAACSRRRERLSRSRSPQ